MVASFWVPDVSSSRVAGSSPLVPYSSSWVACCRGVATALDAAESGLDGAENFVESGVAGSKVLGNSAMLCEAKSKREKEIGIDYSQMKMENNKKGKLTSSDSSDDTPDS
ncbi:MAG: hypothetical protein ACRDDA_08300 [Aeromonas sp.]